MSITGCCRICHNIHNIRNKCGLVRIKCQYSKTAEFIKGMWNTLFPELTVRRCLAETTVTKVIPGTVMVGLVVYALSLIGHYSFPDGNHDHEAEPSRELFLDVIKGMCLGSASCGIFFLSREWFKGWQRSQPKITELPTHVTEENSGNDTRCLQAAKRVLTEHVGPPRSIRRFIATECTPKILGTILLISLLYRFLLIPAGHYFEANIHSHRNQTHPVDHPIGMNEGTLSDLGSGSLVGLMGLCGLLCGLLGIRIVIDCSQCCFDYFDEWRRGARQQMESNSAAATQKKV